MYRLTANKWEKYEQEALYYLDCRMYDKALKIINKALSFAKTPVAKGTCIKSKAVILQFLARPGEALECVNEAIELDPKSKMRYLEHKAILLQMLDRYHESMRCVSEILSSFPDRETMGYLQGVNALSLKSLGKFNKALECIDVSIRLGPSADRGHVYGLKAEILYFLKRFDEALDCVNTALSLDIDTRVVQLGTKADILHALGRLDEALECIDEALPLVEYSTTEGTYKTTKAEILYSLGRYEEALLYINAALGLNPKIERSQRALKSKIMELLTK